MSDITVVKRDGSYEEFSYKKIANGIMGAAIEVDGEDYELADEIASYVTDIIETNNLTTISSKQIQVIVEKVLIEDGHASTAKAYILKAAERDRIREMNSSLMQSFEEITFTSPEDSEIKRENANIDSSTAMGTMLKYGSEGAKKFNMLYMMSSDIADAHANGDIHIHDLDFLALTETCIPADSMLTLKIDGKVRYIQASELETEIIKNLDNKSIYVNIPTYVGDLDIKVLSNNKFVKVNYITMHRAKGKVLMCVETPTGVLKVTSEHKVTIKRNGVIEDIQASQLKIGDTLVIPDNSLKSRVGFRHKIRISELIAKQNYLNKAYYMSNTAECLSRLKPDLVMEALNIDKYTLDKMLSGKECLSVSQYETLYSKIPRNSLNICRLLSTEKVTISNTLYLTYKLGKLVGYTIGSIINQKQNTMTFNNKKSAEKFTSIVNSTFYKKVASIDKKKKNVVHCVNGAIDVLSALTEEQGIKSAIHYEIPKYTYESIPEFRAGIISAFIDSYGKLGARINKYDIRELRFVFNKGIDCSIPEHLQKFLLFNSITSSIQKGFNDETIITVANSEDLNWVRLNTEAKVLDPLKGSCGIDTTDQKICNRLNTLKENNLVITNIAMLYGTEDGWAISEEQESVRVGEFNKGHTEYVFDLTTEDSHFDVDGFRVHNCCQIPLDKLYKDGFNTGHGFLREPGGIRTAGALAAIAIQSNQNDQHGGQSIPLFDYYLAPYVSLSYVKNLAKVVKIKLSLSKEQFNEVKSCLLNYRETIDDKRILAERDKLHKSEIAKVIVDILDYIGVHIGNKRLKEILLDAYDETYDETFQSMEAFLHNLNTMHCLPASERIWVYDNLEEGFVEITMEELDNTFKKGRYKAISVNAHTGIVELKYITASKKKDNNRKLVTLIDVSGRKVRVTDNHRVLTIRNSTAGIEKISEDIPANIDNIIVSTKAPTGITNINNVMLESLFIGNSQNSNIQKTKFNSVGTCKILKREKSNSGNEYVYDISVEDNENFMTYEGIFVHNSRAGRSTVYMVDVPVTWETLCPAV